MAIPGRTVLALALFICMALSGGCSSDKSATGLTELDDTGQPNRQSGIVQWEDAFGSHNPKMIGGWGGEKTKETWFIQNVWSVERFWLLENELINFDIQYNRYPVDWDEFVGLGYYPFRPNDPINFQPIVYGVEPESDDDYTNLGLETSTDTWVINGQATQFPTGDWFRHEWEFTASDEFLAGSMEATRNKYPPDTEAFKGYRLADALHHILWEYEHRRRDMPSSGDELLDGLYYVAQKWAEYDESVDPLTPGSFVFGVDDEKEIAVAIWVDSEGKKFADAWFWNPWPNGWESIPGPDLDTGIRGYPCEVPFGEFIPATILWKSSYLD